MICMKFQGASIQKAPGGPKSVKNRFFLFWAPGPRMRRPDVGPIGLKASQVHSQVRAGDGQNFTSTVAIIRHVGSRLGVEERNRQPFFGPFFGTMFCFYIFFILFICFYIIFLITPGPPGPLEKKMPPDKNLANGRAGGGNFLSGDLFFFPGGPGAWFFIEIYIKTYKKEQKLLIFAIFQYFSMFFKCFFNKFK